MHEYHLDEEMKSEDELVRVSVEIDLPVAAAAARSSVSLMMTMTRMTRVIYTFLSMEDQASLFIVQRIRLLGQRSFK